MKSLLVVLLVAALAFAATAEEAAPVERETAELAPQQEEGAELPEAEEEDEEDEKPEAEEEEEEPAELDLEEPADVVEEEKPEDEEEVPAEEDVDVEANTAAARHNRNTSRIIGLLRAISRKLWSQHRRVRNSQRSINRVWNRNRNRARRGWRVMRGRASTASRKAAAYRRRYISITRSRRGAMSRAAKRTARSKRAMYKELALIKRIECMVWKLRHNGKSSTHRNCMRAASRLAHKGRPPRSKWFYLTKWTRRVGQRWTIRRRSGRRIQIRTIGMCGDSDSGSGPNFFKTWGSGQSSFRWGAGRRCSRGNNYRWRGRRARFWLGCLQTPRRNGRYAFRYKNINKVYRRSHNVYLNFDYHYDWDGMGCKARAMNGKYYRDPRSSVRFLVKYRYIH